MSPPRERGNPIVSHKRNRLPPMDTWWHRGCLVQGSPFVDTGAIGSSARRLMIELFPHPGAPNSTTLILSVKNSSTSWAVGRLLGSRGDQHRSIKFQTSSGTLAGHTGRGGFWNSLNLSSASPLFFQGKFPERIWKSNSAVEDRIE